MLAGGSGARFGGPKQHALLGGRTLLQRITATALARCDRVVVVLPADDLAGHRPAERTTAVAGGAVRAESVRNALAAVPARAEVIVVADAAHPLAPVALFDAVIAAVRRGADGAVPGLPLTEAVKRVGPDGTAGRTTPAAGHVLAQLPQAFRAGALRVAHAGGTAGVEDSAMVTAAGGRVVLVPGDPLNVHVTTPAELALAELLLPGIRAG